MIEAIFIRDLPEILKQSNRHGPASALMDSAEIPGWHSCRAALDDESFRKSEEFTDDARSTQAISPEM